MKARRRLDLWHVLAALVVLAGALVVVGWTPNALVVRVLVALVAIFLGSFWLGMSWGMSYAIEKILRTLPPEQALKIAKRTIENES